MTAKTAAAFHQEHTRAAWEKDPLTAPAWARRGKTILTGASNWISCQLCSAWATDTEEGRTWQAEAKRSAEMNRIA